MAYNYQNDSFMAEHKRKCPVCGKVFWASAEWVYKKGYSHCMRVYCSWKCLRQEEKDKTPLKDKIDRAILDGLTNAEIKELLGVTQHQIDYRRDRVIRDEGGYYDE